MKSNTADANIMGEGNSTADIRGEVLVSLSYNSDLEPDLLKMLFF